MNIHTFNGDIACKVGVEAAIIYQFALIDKSVKLKSEYCRKHTVTLDSGAREVWFDYMSKAKFKKSIKSLVESKLLIPSKLKGIYYVR